MPTYPWKRFWAPRDGQIDLSDEGFLADPESESFWYSPNPDLKAFDQISALPCLVLLGEPGIGKSTAIIRELETTEVKARDLGDAVLNSIFGRRTPSQLCTAVSSTALRSRVGRQVNIICTCFSTASTRRSWRPIRWPLSLWMSCGHSIALG
jgi:hypothetical protein